METKFFSNAKNGFKSYLCIVILIFSFLFVQFGFSQQSLTAVSATKPILVKGVWNPIFMINDDCNCDSILLIINNGMIKQDSGCAFRVRPASIETLIIYILKKNNSIALDSIYLNVDELKVNDVVVHAQHDEGLLTKLDSISIKSFDINHLGLQYYIKGFTVSIVNGYGKSVCSSRWNEGNAFSPETQACFDSLPKRYRFFWRRGRYFLRITFVRFEIDNEVFSRHTNSSYTL